MQISLYELICATGLSRKKLAPIFKKSRQTLGRWSRGDGMIPGGAVLKLMTGNVKQRAILRLVKAYRVKKKQNPNYGVTCQNHPVRLATYRKQEIRFQDGTHQPDFQKLPKFYCDECGQDEYLNEPNRTKIIVQKLSSFNNLLLANLNEKPTEKKQN